MLKTQLKKGEGKLSFKTDDGGMALSLKDCKLMTTGTASTWNTRLSQARSKVVIVTYSIPDVRYASKILEGRADRFYIVMNSKFRDKAMALKKRHPNLKITMRNDVHAKMVLVEPRTVWLSSANFGRSGWFEHTIGIHDERAYEFYKRRLEEYLGKEV